MTHRAGCAHRHTWKSRTITGGIFLFTLVAIGSLCLPTKCQAQSAIEIVETRFPDGLDPFTFRGLESYRLLNLYAAPMVEISSKRTAEKRLADTVISGERDWTIRLLPNQFFADGHLCPQADPAYAPVGARDVEASYRAFIDPRTQIGDPEIRDLLIERVADLKALDDRTVRVQFRPGIKDLPRYAALEFPVMPAKVLGSGYVTRQKDPAVGTQSPVVLRPYAAGYYYLQEITASQRLELARNERLPEHERAKIASLKINYCVNYDSKINDIVGGNWGLPICWPDMPVEKIAVLSTAAEHKRIPLTMNRYNYVAFNCARATFKDARVRQALSCAINRTQLLSSYAGEGDTITGPIPSDSPYRCDTCRVEAQTYDPDLAGRLLEEAGWRLQPSRRRVNGQGQPLSIRLLTYKEAGLVPAQVAERIKGFWDDIGVTTNVVSFNTDEYNRRTFGEKDFDAVFGVWSFFGDPGLSATFRTGGSLNFIGYSNPELDRMLDSIPRLETDEKTLLYHRLHKRIAEEAPYAFLYSIHRYALLNVMIDVGPNVDPFNFFRRINEWSLK